MSDNVCGAAQRGPELFSAGALGVLRFLYREGYSKPIVVGLSGICFRLMGLPQGGSEIFQHCPPPLLAPASKDSGSSSWLLLSLPSLVSSKYPSQGQQGPTQAPVVPPTPPISLSHVSPIPAHMWAGADVGLTKDPWLLQDLMADLKSEISGDLARLILGLMMPPAHYDAKQLKKAMEV